MKKENFPCPLYSDIHVWVLQVRMLMCLYIDQNLLATRIEEENVSFNVLGFCFGARARKKGKSSAKELKTVSPRAELS